MGFVCNKCLLGIDSRLLLRESTSNDLTVLNKVVCSRHHCCKDLYCFHSFPQFSLDICLFITPVMCSAVLAFLR